MGVGVGVARPERTYHPQDSMAPPAYVAPVEPPKYEDGDNDRVGEVGGRGQEREGRVEEREGERVPGLPGMGPSGSGSTGGNANGRGENPADVDVRRDQTTGS